MSEYRPYNYDFKPSTCLASLNWGCKADWYLSENVDACKEQVPYEKVGNKLWPRGWFAVVKYINHDPFRDSVLNKKCEKIMAGPFPTKEAAMEEATSRLDEFVCELS